mgnify:CR=1 FL=1
MIALLAIAAAAAAEGDDARAPRRASTRRLSGGQPRDPLGANWGDDFLKDLFGSIANGAHGGPGVRQRIQ